MNTTRLLIRSHFYYWRTNLAVLLGVMAGTAVISGALIVGDSVRGSLQKMSRDRLGDIDHVLRSQRFFRQALAEELSQRHEFAQRFKEVAPALVMTGALEHRPQSVPQADGDADGAILRVGKVNVYGVGETLWNMTKHEGVEAPGDGEIILSQRAARQLQLNGSAHEAQNNQTVSLWVEIPASVPRDSLLGKRAEISREVPLVVKAILDEKSGVGRLNLNPNQQLPLNAFVSLETLQRQLDLHRREDRRTRVVTPARVNSLFIQTKSESDREGDDAVDAAQLLTKLLSERLTLADLSLRVIRNIQHNYLSLETDQQILAEVFADAGEKAATRLNLTQSPVLVYLANKIANASDETKFSRYSIVAGLDIASPPPFDSFHYADGGPPADDQIVLDRWLGDDLDVAVGDDVKLSYYEVGNHGELLELVRTFKVRGIVEMQGTALDRGLTPEVEGITDVEDFDDWDVPFPMKTVTSRDDEYWTLHKATPKAFVTLSTSQTLWQSRYGQLTSLRVSPPEGGSLEEGAALFADEVLRFLNSDEIDMAFDAVKARQLQAADGPTDFTELFLAFSFFLIASAAILIGLLFRLGIERRSTSVGLLGAVGFAPRRVGRLFLAEGLFIVITGGLLGLLAAWGYASIMVYGLKTWWYGAIGTRFLEVYLTARSLAGGFMISVVVAALAIWWSMRQLRALPTRELLSGATEPELTGEARQRRGRKTTKIAAVSAVAATLVLIGALIGLIPNSEAFEGFSWQVVAFFLVGILLLTASLSFLSAWLDSDRSAAVRGAGFEGMAWLGMRNAARHRQRSVLTASLIASATFVIVAVAAGHRNPAIEKPVKESGNGGFTLVAETSQPVYADLNTVVGRDKHNILFDETGPDKRQQNEARRKNALLKSMNVMPFRVKPGEDASCLNIYQTQFPTILGVPQRMIERGGFKFSGAKQANLWTLLNVKHEDEKSKDGKKTIPVYPVLVDMNTLQYSLHKAVGSTIAVPDEKTPDYRLKIIGRFDGSIFQGVLLMSEENFHRLYPNRKGYEYFLIEASTTDADELSGLLETGLNDVGFDTEPVAKRLDDFLSVQNTYLSTFQTLGGLGLLLGTLGLATVMLRNVLERRAELALLRAVGFCNSHLVWLVLWENAFLLVWGLLAGTVSALLAMTPHLMSIGADIPWAAGALILGGVFLAGMAAALLAVSEAVRTPIVATLRSE